jgi:anti-anti-sigma regulatory factor
VPFVETPHLLALALQKGVKRRLECAVTKATAHIWAGTPAEDVIILRRPLDKASEAEVQQLACNQDMMRIQVHQSAKDCTLKIEGEIEGLAATELEKCWRTMAHSHSELVVDFTYVTFVGRSARALLKSMHQSGVKFAGARLAIRDVLDEITARIDRY